MRVLVALVITDLIDVVMCLAVAITDACSEVAVCVDVRVNAAFALQHGHKFRVTKTVLVSSGQIILVVTVVSMATRIPQQLSFLRVLRWVARPFLFPRFHAGQSARGFKLRFTVRRGECSADLNKVHIGAADTSLDSGES